MSNMDKFIHASKCLRIKIYIKVIWFLLWLTNRLGQNPDAILADIEFARSKTDTDMEQKLYADFADYVKMLGKG